MFIYIWKSIGRVAFLPNKRCIKCRFMARSVVCKTTGIENMVFFVLQNLIIIFCKVWLNLSTRPLAYKCWHWKKHLLIKIQPNHCSGCTQRGFTSGRETSKLAPKIQFYKLFLGWWTPSACASVNHHFYKFHEKKLGFISIPFCNFL